jgi:hypothetical protein
MDCRKKQLARRIPSAADIKTSRLYRSTISTTMIRAILLVMIISVAAFFSTSAYANHLNYLGPTGLSASVNGGDVTLTWDPYGSFPSDCSAGREIRIFREDNGSGTFTQITSVVPGATTHTDLGLADGTYAYRIQARCNVPAVPMVSPADTNNLSAFSNIATATVTSAPACAGAPAIEASASPLALWPPNGKLTPVTVMGTVTPQANCSLPGSIMYSIVDEYGELSTASPVPVALSGANFTFQVSLEASRLGNDLDGRFYAIELDTIDGGMFDIYVIVPHDQRKK